MLLVQLLMSETIISLLDEKAATTDKLRRVEELECLLAETKRCLAVERSTMHDLKAEVAYKDQRLKVALARESELVAQLEDTHKQLNYKKSASFYMDEAITCRSTYMAVFSSIEEDIQAFFSDFDLECLQCMTDYLTMQKRVKEAKEENSESDT